MNKLVLIVLALLLGLTGFCQNNIITLHPAVGDQIDLSEKVDYLLFPELDNSTYKVAQIRCVERTYTLNALSGGLIKTLDSLEINTYRQNIDKLFRYYSNCALTDTTQNLFFSKGSDELNFNTDLLSPAKRKEIVLQSRRYQSLRSVALDKGLSGEDLKNYIKTNGYWEIFVGKKK